MGSGIGQDWQHYTQRVGFEQPQSKHATSQRSASHYLSGNIILALRNKRRDCVFYWITGLTSIPTPVKASPIPPEVILRTKTLTKISVIAAAIAFLIPFASQNVRAQGKHPAYLHALSDLRDARAHLERPDGGALHAEERAAVEEIDHAIEEIKRAAIEDGKNIADRPPVDPHNPWVGRLHDAREPLDMAHRDLEHEEDNPQARGLRDRVIAHIDRAHHHVDEAIAIADHH
jgi:hypothetical protein